MSAIDAATTDHGDSDLFDIRIKGHLADRWVDWLAGLAITLHTDGTTTLRGPLADQAALHGVLNRIRDLGLPIISVRSMSHDRTRSSMMNAIAHETYGSPDVLKFKEVAKPVVKDNDVLVRVQASSVNQGDWFLLTGKPFLVRLMGYGLLKPKNTVPGQDLAGRVEAVGKNVTEFHPGDEVFGEASGAFAEYASVPEEKIVRKPANLTFEQAAAVPVAAITALQGLRDSGKIRPGHNVLINGASGGVGTFAVQIAKSFGAEVTGVCSTRNVAMVRSLGADQVVDYTQEDFVQSGRRYDLVLDLVGNRSVSDWRRVLASQGIYVSSSGRLGWLVKALLASLVWRRNMVLLVAKPNQKDLIVLRELLEAGKVTPVIDRRYPLSEVPEALRRQGAGHAQGKTVITV